MSVATPPPVGQAHAPLPQRLALVQQQLAAQRRNTTRSAWLTALVGAAALALCGAYFAYGYGSIAEVAQPKKLVDVAESLAQDNLPEARAAIEEEIKRAAPKLAEDLSRQMLDNLPTARGKLEEHALSQFDNAADEAAVLTDKQFRDFLKENRPLIEAKFKELADKPELSDASLAEIEAALEKQLEADMKSQARTLLETVTASNQKLARLKDGKKLTADEQIERRTLMLARRLQAEQVGDNPATDRPAPTGGGKRTAPPAGKDKPKAGDVGKKDAGKKDAPPATKPPAAKKE